MLGVCGEPYAAVSGGGVGAAAPHSAKRKRAHVGAKPWLIRTMGGKRIPDYLIAGIQRWNAGYSV